MSLTMYHDIIKMCLNMYQNHQDMPQACTTTSNACTSNMCHNLIKKCLKHASISPRPHTWHLIHVPKYASNHAHKMCLKHIPMPQQDTKGTTQACTITSSTCNQDVPQTMCLKHVPTSINHVPRDIIKHVPYHS
jgi:hypothetical protein